MFLDCTKTTPLQLHVQKQQLHTNNQVEHVHLIQHSSEVCIYLGTLQNMLNQPSMQQQHHNLVQQLRSTTLPIWLADTAGTAGDAFTNSQ
jgi:hypothetical protein